jgi:hypothetical protein
MTVPDAVSAGSTPPATESREHVRPMWAVVGAFLFAVLGLAMLVPAVHIATEPILLPTAAGPAFDCGTALQPPTKAFPVRVCGEEPRREQERAAAWGTAAVIVGLGGVLAFLLPTRARSARHTRRRAGDNPDAEVS